MKKISNCLDDLVLAAGKASRIVLISSYGVQSRFFTYNALGIGNLIAHAAFALAIKNEDTQISTFPLPQFAYIRQPIATFYSRSHFRFAVPSPSQPIVACSRYQQNHIYCHKRNILYLNTNCISIPDYYAAFQKFKVNEISNIFGEAAALLGISFKSFSLSPDSIGIHIRMNDFSTRLLESVYNSSVTIPVNTTPPIDFFQRALTLAKTNPYSKLVLYTDASSKELAFLRFRLQSFIPSGCHVSVFPRLSSPSQLLLSMASHAVLIHSASTLSTVASILSGNIGFYPYLTDTLGMSRILPNFQRVA